MLRAGTLHWFHWMVVAASLLLTFFAWYFSKKQIQEKVQNQFERQASQVVDLVVERMQKYEDALWGGVGAARAMGDRVDWFQWKKFAHTLSIEKKYPGISGIGVIYRVAPDELDTFLENQRIQQPDFRVHPFQERKEYLPITFIEPVENNLRAVGLDMAHETNRYTAAKLARDTGVAQITGPIVLVQDAKQTPGFLFYAPMYKGGPQTSVGDRRSRFVGLIYAPFIVKELMEGTLSKQKRHVGIRINDGRENIYNEHIENDPDFDPDPLYQKTIATTLYGRQWSFDIQSTTAFRLASGSSQPWTILWGGLAIDTLLLLLFLSISRANRGAVAYADRANAALREESKIVQKRGEELERSNAELEQFAYVASHDLQEPLRMVTSYCELIQIKLQDTLDAKTTGYLGYVLEGAGRMRELIDGLLEYGRVGAEHQGSMGLVDCNTLMKDVLKNLEVAIADNGAKIQVEPLPTVRGISFQLLQVFQNLISNSIKFRGEFSPNIRVYAEPKGSTHWTFHVQDNGIGIDPEYAAKIFQMFQRLHDRDEYNGIGVGLAVTKKIVERQGGSIQVQSTPGEGSTFSFTLPVEPLESPSPQDTGTQAN